MDLQAAHDWMQDGCQEPFSVDFGGTIYSHETVPYPLYSRTDDPPLGSVDYTFESHAPTSVVPSKLFIKQLEKASHALVKKEEMDFITLEPSAVEKSNLLCQEQETIEEPEVTLSSEQQRVVEMVQSGASIFFTGSAG